MVSSTTTRRIAIIAAAAVVGVGGVVVGGGNSDRTPSQQTGGGGGGSGWTSSVGPLTGTTLTCDRNATTGTLTTQVSSATTGQTICLASGSYGTWSGTDTNKAITLTAASGASVSMALDLGQNDQGFTIDGTGGGGTFTITSGNIVGNGDYVQSAGDPKNLTFKNIIFSGSVTVDYIVNGNSKFSHTSWNDINVDGGRLHFAYGDWGVETGWTIEWSEFRRGYADGIQGSGGVTIQYNEFDSIEEGACGACHTDSLQWDNTAPSVPIIKGNWFHGGADAIALYDGIALAQITDNVVSSDDAARCIELYSDGLNNDSVTSSAANGSTIQHNTLYTAGAGGQCGITLSYKDDVGQPQGKGTIVKDNITANVSQQCKTGCGTLSSTSANTNNLMPGASSPNIAGTATFTGSATAYNNFYLTTGSSGHLGASDGLDVGIR